MKINQSLRQHLLLLTGMTALWSVLCALLIPVHALADNREVFEIRVPILMYHSILQHENDSEYCLPAEDFREDMLYLQHCGYTAVFVSDLVNYDQKGTALPEKPIVVTLDDGYLNGLTAVLPILEETGMKATISVVGAYTEMSIEQNDPNPAYAYLTWDDIQTLAASGRVEIGNHTWAMHDLKPRKGTQKCSGESVESYQAALRTDLTELQTCLREKSGVTPTVFAYPYGCISPEALPVLKELGFQAALTCDERINTLTGNSDELYSLGRFNRPSGISTADFMFQAGIG